MSMLTLFEIKIALVMLAKLLLWVCLLSLNQYIHWREGTALVMLAKLLLWVCLLSLNQYIHWREGTALVMLAKLLLWVCLLSLNQYIHWREGTALVMLICIYRFYSIYIYSTTSAWKFKLSAYYVMPFNMRITKNQIVCFHSNMGLRKEQSFLNLDWNLFHFFLKTSDKNIPKENINHYQLYTSVKLYSFITVKLYSFTVKFDRLLLLFNYQFSIPYH